MSMESTLVVLVIFLTTLFATHSSAQSSIPTEPTFFYQVCDSEYGNYTAKSAYAANLQTVLTTLQNQSSVNPFYNTSAGSGAGKVYGQYYCRFDVDSALCNACISEATALTDCPNFKSSIIWYDVCSLRYRNQSMSGVPDTSWYSYHSSTKNVSDPDSFYLTLNSTLTKLTAQAAYGNNFMKFATAEVQISTVETTYFLVQCSPDLSPADCEACLSGIDFYVDTCCGNWPVWATVFFPSCQMRYTNFLFYTAPPSPPSSPSPPQVFAPPTPPQVFSPPPPNDFLPPPPSPGKAFSPEAPKKDSSERVKVGFAVISLALLTLQLYFWPY